MIRLVLACLLTATLAGCDEGPSTPLDPSQPTRFDYTPPEDSGLIGIRPYPSGADVCMVIGENDQTNDLLDDQSLLIGCPKHERGAIGDRQAEGARIVAYQGHWALLSVPRP